MNATPEHLLRLPVDAMVDGYRVKRLLGEGAMGEIYLALDEKLGRQVALKFLKGLDAAGTAQFLEESRITARFSHPHIVTVYGAGLHETRPYLALEYLDGTSLRERLDGGPIPTREAMRLGRAMAEALAEAHRHNVIHADLKPENVVVPRDGRARVLDFGLSRLVGKAETASSGTPAYMAPERWSGAAPLPPIDVWALAMIVCEALDGVRVLRDRELVALAYTPKKVELGRVSGASPCAELLSRCLAIRPEDRPSAEEIASTLETLLAGKTVDETRSPFRGLEPFTEADAQDFHGRDADTDAAVERLRTRGLVPIIGPSGVGKSSFIAAGLVPRLKEAGPQVVISLRPGRKPWVGLTNALATAGGDRELLAGREPGSLLRALRQLAAVKQARVLLAIDQFEEAVTLAEPDEAKALLDALAVVPMADEPCRIVLTLRSDFLGSFATTRLEGSLADVMVLRPLGVKDLEQAVLAPLTRVQYRPDEPSLAHRIAVELDGQASALPLMQFAMDSLWRRRDSGLRVVLTREYEAMGGALGALAGHAERIALELTDTQRGFTRALMLQLVNVDGTRRPRTREELLAKVGPDGAESLDHLLRNRLLSSGTNAETGAALIELAHESLTTNWPALTRWLAETQEARTLSHEIEQAAKLWESRGRRETETWAADAVRDTRRRVQTWQIALDPLQEAFLLEGERRAERLQRARRLRQTALVVGLTALSLVGIVTTLVFRQKEQEAIAQQKEIRTAAADMGRFTLRIELFDWDADALKPNAVDARDYSALQVRFHTVDRQNEPGPLVDERYVVRNQPRFSSEAREEVIELRADPTWIEITGRGKAGEQCSPSWLLARALPGYAAREQLKTVPLKVPTCQATLAGTVEIPGGPFLNDDWTLDAGMVEEDLPTFRIDRFEVTEEAFRVYDSHSALTGEVATYHTAAISHGRQRLPMGMLDAASAEQFCRFMGKQLQSRPEWRKASRGGLWLDREHTKKNPDPRRITVWGNSDSTHVNVARPTRNELAQVGATPDDRSPYDVYDLAANMREWSRDKQDDGLQVNAGASWADQSADILEAELFRIDRSAASYPIMRKADIGARCSSQ
jgi:formylglycine-generating enzyme required for sulfatase activity